MDSEKMEAVCSELLENQKEIYHFQAEIMLALQELKAQIGKLESEIHKQKCSAVSLDLKALQQVLDKGITDMKFSTQAQLQKPEPNNWRIFLESDAKKWAVYLLVTLTFLTYLYRFFMR